MSWGAVIVRVVVGGLFVGHGLQKLNGSFNGPGLEGTEKMMESLEMEPAKTNALAVSLAETGAGAAIVAGAATPLAAGGLIASMVTAIRKVHAKNGVWNSNGGFEYNAVLIAVLTALAAEGPGKASFDALFGKARWGAKGALTALALGIGGSIAAVEMGRRTAEKKSAESGGDLGGTAEG
ncbi:putative oxidoreductase [Paramicrobacterium humi]|uniref:Putative oxidoreductase n=1 Tax=Paramicrobacterium humi TaxID=640635 RepID=A0A1H4MEN0_9MICO|nr:DoxX family protein [Microbacterium humi]SEB81184.1 putative oxidoreductase [Microbacterium humi]